MKIPAALLLDGDIMVEAAGALLVPRKRPLCAQLRHGTRGQEICDGASVLLDACYALNLGAEPGATRLPPWGVLLQANALLVDVTNRPFKRWLVRSALTEVRKAIDAIPAVLITPPAVPFGQETIPHNRQCLADACARMQAWLDEDRGWDGADQMQLGTLFRAIRSVEGRAASFPGLGPGRLQWGAVALTLRAAGCALSLLRLPGPLQPVSINEPFVANRGEDYQLGDYTQRRQNPFAENAMGERVDPTAQPAYAWAQNAIDVFRASWEARYVGPLAHKLGSKKAASSFFRTINPIAAGMRRDAIDRLRLLAALHYQKALPT